MSTLAPSGAVTAQPDPPAVDQRVVHRLRLLALCAVLTAATFLQEPGRIASDTKLDLTADPWRFLGRALHLWEPLGFLGQVQNQAYGYLFPMGPFFALGHSAGLPEWVIQRLWMSMLLCLAVLGVNRLAAQLGIGTPTARLFGALAFALAPRVMSTLGPVSIEALPMVLASWVLVPLVRGARGGSPRRAALQSAVAVLCMGGVNAVETLAVLPLAVLYLATRERGTRRARLAAWWGVGVLGACLWWLVPLVLMGKVSPPFLDWIESARTTTGKTSLVEVLRGTSHWVAFLSGPAGPEWRGGWLLVTLPAAILDTAIIAVGGLVGLCLRGMPERRWLRLALLAGVAMVCFGHVGALNGIGAESQRSLLDGAFAPLRNVHKFDPVLRVPLVLGLTHLVGRVLDRRSPLGRLRSVQVAVLGVVVIGLVGSGTPLVNRSLVPRGSFLEIPPYWQRAADWLAAHGSNGRALLVPGASFGDYYWGRPKDEPLQTLATTPWAVRDAVPLTNAGGVRMLDAVQSRLATGTASPGLAAYLARSGVSYLVVRNDLDYAVAGSARPVLVHQSIALSGGLDRVATFGPTVGGGTPDLALDQQLDRPYPAVEVFEVTSRADFAVLVPDSGVGSVQGGSEGLLDALDAAAPVPAVALMDGGDGVGSSRLVTDTPARRELDFGRLDHHASGVLTLTDPLRLGNPARDYLPPGADAQVTVARQDGVQLAVSSSLADAGSLGGVLPASGAFAAFDGRAATSWVAGDPSGAVGQWLRATFPSVTQLQGGTIEVAMGLPGPQVDVVEVVTDVGSTRFAVPANGLIALPPVRTRQLVVRAVAVAGGGAGSQFGLTEIRVPGIAAARPLVLPVKGSASGYVLTAPVGAVPGCVHDSGGPLCAVGLSRPGEEDGGIDRVLTGSTSGKFEVMVQALARPGAALDSLLARGADVIASATSSSVADADGSAARVADGDPSTGWVAAPTDHNPILTFAFANPRRLTGITVTVDPRLAASPPGSVIVSLDGRRVGARLGASGVVNFPETLTRTVVVSFADVAPKQSYDPFSREFSLLPVGVSELSFNGAEAARATVRDSTQISWGCGEGPTVAVDGTPVETAGIATVGQLRLGLPIAFAGCGPAVTVGSGARIVARPLPTLSVRSISLRAPGERVPTQLVVALGRDRWGPVDRLLAVPSRDTSGVIAVREASNPGWSATLAGRRLVPVVVDGWQQGWRVPAGAAGTVHLVFSPDNTFRTGLLGGLAAALLLLAGAFLMPQRGGRVRGPVLAAELRRDRRLDPWVIAGASATLAIVCASALPLLGVFTAVMLGGRRTGGLLVPAVLVGAGVASFALVLYPHGTFSPYAGSWGWVQLCVGGALAAAAVVAPSSRPEPVDVSAPSD